MITFMHSVSGEEIGRQLAADDEELAYCLLELMRSETADYESVCSYLDTQQRDELAAWLRGLADTVQLGSD